MSQPFKLYRLQQLDSQLDKISLRLNEIEAELQDDSDFQNAHQQAEIADRNLHDRRKELKRAEENLQSQRTKIEQTESTLYSGKVINPKELQDLENESAALKRYRGVLEDRLLEAMMAEEEAQESFRVANFNMNEQKTILNLSQNKLKKEKKGLQADFEVNKEERAAATGSIPEKDLALYEQLRTQRMGIAVSKVNNKACSACGTILSATLLHAARNPNQLNRCETCSRILYVG
jgi:predicted  nucleic acid-binding Zn-ribbon protein